MWHASVALLGRDGRATPTAQVSRKDRRLGQEYARRLLEGAGCGDLIEHTKEIAFHARRRLAVPELARIDAAWLAIEPVDMG